MRIGTTRGGNEGWDCGLKPRRGVRGTWNIFSRNPLFCVCEKRTGDIAGTSLTPGLPGIISISSRTMRDSRILQFVSGWPVGKRRALKADRLGFKAHLPCLLAVLF